MQLLSLQGIISVSCKDRAPLPLCRISTTPKEHDKLKLHYSLTQIQNQQNIIQLQVKLGPLDTDDARTIDSSFPKSDLSIRSNI